MCGLTTRERQTAASTAPMPNARPWRRGQAPKPRSGAPKAQGFTATIAGAAPSNVPSFALKSTRVDRPIGTSATPGIHTTLTDVTLRDHPVGGFPEHDQRLANRIIVDTARRSWTNPPPVQAAAKQTSGMFAVKACHRHELVQDLAALRAIASPIPLDDRSNQLVWCCHATRLIIHPAPNLRRATNQMRQQVPSRQHFR